MRKYLQPKIVFRVCSTYGMGLSLLLSSGYFTPRCIEIFMPDGPAALGTHGAYWQRWQAVSCLFVATINRYALGWSDTKAINDLLKANVLVFGLWGLQLAHLSFAPDFCDKFQSAMKLHTFASVCCGMYAFATYTQQ